MVRIVVRIRDTHVVRNVIRIRDTHVVRNVIRIGDTDVVWHFFMYVWVGGVHMMANDGQREYNGKVGKKPWTARD